MVRFERSAMGDFIWVYENGAMAGNIERHGNLFLAYLGEKVETAKKIAECFSLEQAKVQMLLALASKARKARNALGFVPRERERSGDDLPLCSCGSAAILQGRYSTEKGLLVWRYDVKCASRCGKKVRLLGDIFTYADAINAWFRNVNSMPCN
ncbi:hypothetical protein VC841_23305 [Citrobacter freundii]|nr:hypothetical protein [Citrobacter freundii]HAT2303781.1 hypothetical protein [Citrobacter freundii]